MLAMSPRPTTSKVLLVADPRNAPAGPSSVPIRRFRLARLRLDPRPVNGPARFDHLKRVYE
jgi:hypothetical protein